MPSTERAERLFTNIVRLRDAQSRLPGDEGLAAVLADLEQEIGPTVSRNLAARLLGVSHTGLQRWIDAGDVPLVLDERGRSGVPVAGLLRLHDAVRERRANSGRTLHVLEPLMLEGRDQARRLAAGKLLERPLDDFGNGHDRASRRAQAYHAALARQLRKSHVQEGRRQLRRFVEAGRIDPFYADQWQDVLARPLPEIRRALTEDSPQADDLRQNSPLAGLLSEAERRAIMEKIS